MVQVAVPDPNAYRREATWFYTCLLEREDIVVYRAPGTP